jgi:hypothetical protein
MPHHSLYVQIAARYLEAARLTASTIPEASTFATYHAFESIACAWIRSRNRNVPLSHPTKLKLFLTLSNGQPFRRGAAVLEIELNAQRNRMLYPVPGGAGTYSLPETFATEFAAQNLIRRVAGLMSAITPHL